MSTGTSRTFLLKPSAWLTSSTARTSATMWPTEYALISGSCSTWLVAKAVAAGSVPPEMKEVWENLRSSGVRTEIIDRRETGNAERELPDLHLQREMLLDALLNKPGTVVLLTGDSAGWAYNKGFLPVLKGMKQRGWHIEVLSWSHSCNTWLRQWVVQNGHFTSLDTFYPSITFLKPSENRQEWGGAWMPALRMWSGGRAWMVFVHEGAAVPCSA